MGKVINPLRDVNEWAKGFLIAPLISALGAIGLAFYEKKQSARLQKPFGGQAKGIAQSESKKEEKQ
jgi:hypothetical protein